MGGRGHQNSLAGHRAGMVIFPIRVASYCEHNFSYKHIESLDLRAGYR